MKYTGWCQNEFNVGVAAPRVVRREGRRRQDVAGGRVHLPEAGDAQHLGFGRSVASEIEVLNLLVNVV